MERTPRAVLLFAFATLGCFGRVAAEPEADADVFYFRSMGTMDCELVRNDHGVDTILASDSTGLYSGGVVADSTNLYFKLQSTGFLRMPIGGGTPVPFVSAGPSITSMVADDTRVYWGEQVPDDLATYVRAHAK
jgi:hypothetical protein